MNPWMLIALYIVHLWICLIVHCSLETKYKETFKQVIPFPFWIKDPSNMACKRKMEGKERDAIKLCGTVSSLYSCEAKMLDVVILRCLLPIHGPHQVEIIACVDIFCSL